MYVALLNEPKHLPFLSPQPLQTTLLFSQTAHFPLTLLTTSRTTWQNISLLAPFHTPYTSSNSDPRFQKQLAQYFSFLSSPPPGSSVLNHRSFRICEALKYLTLDDVIINMDFLISVSDACGQTLEGLSIRGQEAGPTGAYILRRLLERLVKLSRFLLLALIQTHWWPRIDVIVHFQMER